MKILIIDIDSKIPNIALKKVEKYHLDKGDQVVWNNELLAYTSDKIYVSCIYDWNKKEAEYWEAFPQAIIGGSGYSLKITLPPEIEKMKPKINIGFTTRGCPRKCPPCIVWKKEGNIKVVGDIYDFWDRESKDIVVLDNNLLALIEQFFKITDQVKKENLRVDFNQGLDCRLLTNDIARRLSKISHKEYRFAFDNMKDEKPVIRGIKILEKHNINRCSWYVLVGFNTTLEQDLYRLNLLRDLGQNAYVQRYSKDKKYIPLARWANQHHIFQGMTWKQFMGLDENKKYRHYYKGNECVVKTAIK